MESGRTVVASLLSLSALDKNDWESTMQQILRVDAEVLGLERVNYWSLQHDPEAIHCEMGYVAGPEAFERGLTLTEEDAKSYFREVRRAALVEVEDALSDPRTADIRPYLQRRRIVALLDVPIWVRGELVGVLCHEQTDATRRWRESDRDFAVSVAQVVASALEARNRTYAEKAEHRAEFLDRVSRALAACLEPADVAACALSVAIPDLADWGVLDVIENSRMRRLALEHATPEGRRHLQALTRAFPPAVGGPHLTSGIVERGESILVPEIDYDDLFTRFRIEPEHARMMQALDVRSLIGVPLSTGTEVMGAVVLGSTIRQYDGEDLRLAEDYALRITAALSNARSHRRAQDAIRARDEFISLAAHELHTPLASLQLASEALATRATDAPRQDLIRMGDTIVRQVHRLNQLVDHMLDASRIGSRKFTLSPEPTDLSRLVREVVKEFGERFARAGSRLDVHVQDRVVGRWDGSRLEQVVSNLLDNAVKFGAGRPVEVTLRREGQAAVLVVRDRGIGIPPERLPHVFDQFERAVSPRSFGGLGLGLFVARGIVEGHGGRIEVESERGQGSTFTVTLPGAAEG